MVSWHSQINTLASFLPHAAPQGEFLSSAFKLWLNAIDLEHVVIQMIIRTGLQVRLRSVWTSGWEFLKDNASSRTSEPLQAVVHYTNYLINSITPMRGSSLATKPGRKYCSGKNDTDMEIFLYHVFIIFIWWNVWSSSKTHTIINLVVNLHWGLSGDDSTLALLKKEKKNCND